MFKGGLNLKFVEHEEWESLDKADPSSIARNTLRLLMMGWPGESWKEFLSWPLFKAVFLQENPTFLKELRLAFQQGFELLYTQLKNQHFNAEQQEQIQLYISNCLSLLPYSNLTPYESIKIPQCIQGEWVLAEYYITPIELTPTQGWERFFIEDRDRVFAYGLEPINPLEAQPHLIFMGTTYPTGQGFLPQIKTDMEGFETVGTSLYRGGEQRIKRWLMRQNKKTHVCGLSLGGSLSLLLALHMGDYLDRVDVLNPAGLHDPWLDNPYDQWDYLKIKPQVVVQQQADDPVSIFGIWKNDWQILEVQPPETKRGPNPFWDHFLNYAAFAETEFTYVDPKQQNASRGLRNFWIYSLGRSLVYYSFIVPYTYVIRPLLYTAIKNWTFFLLGTVLLSTLIGLTVAGIIPIVALLCTLGLSALAATGYILNKLDYLYSEESQTLAKMHDPSLPRNSSMDIYNKNLSIELDFTYKELNTYYRVVRGLVKQKEWISSRTGSKMLNATSSKRDLLLASENPENQNTIARVSTTKAKAVHMRHILRVFDACGLNYKQLRKEAEIEFERYSSGKWKT